MEVNAVRLVRVFFRKADRGIYISHLDLNRSMQRALKRSRLNIWYTQGYNPHIYLTFALPLSLGFEGIRESMDIRVLGDTTNEEVAEKLSAAFPPCITLVEVCDAELDPKEIALADYDITFDGNEDDLAKFIAFSNKDEIMAEKKTKKKGITEINLAPLFKVIESSVKDGEVFVKLRVAAGNQLNINPTLIIGAYDKEVVFNKIVRTGVFTAEEKTWN